MPGKRFTVDGGHRSLQPGLYTRLPTYSLCMECKQAGHVCVTVAGGIACMGPVTQAGCGALCPGFGRGCYGCFGPCDTANTAALRHIWRERLGLSEKRIRHAFQGINAWAHPFRQESERPVTDSKTIQVKQLARVEGDGGLLVKFRDGRPTLAQFTITEPPRLFEAFLRGRHFTEVPDITARICGICPLAHMLSAGQAMEKRSWPGRCVQTHNLRRLLFLGEWIVSHSLHIFLLKRP